jgi:hypothetical protein
MFVRQAGRLGLERGGRLRPSEAVRRDVDALLRRHLRVLLERQPFSHRLETPWLGADAEPPAAVNISPSPASISPT